MSQALLFPPSVNNLSKQINADYTAGATTVTLNNTTNIQNKPGVCIVNRITSGGTRQNTTAWTYLKFTGTSGSTLTGVSAISGDQDHAIGEVVEFVSDVTQQQAILDALSNLVVASTGVVDNTKIPVVSGGYATTLTTTGTTNVTLPTSGTIVTTDATQTITNKRITNRIVTTTDDATAEINVDTTDQYQLSAIANATTFTVTGTPTDGQKLIIRFKDAGVAKGLTFTGFTAMGATIPTTTTAGKWGYVGCIYNSAASTWHVLVASTEA